MMKRLTAIALLLLLTSCSQSRETRQPENGTAAPATPLEQASSELPLPYKNYGTPFKGGVCAVERAPDSSETDIGVAGWGFLNAETGDIPQKIILKVASGTGAQYFVPPMTVRPDVATFFKNEKLANSGFVQVLPIPKSKRPATVSAILAFNGKLYECPTTLTIGS